jgi:2-alkyl-3-oxoalkanoate reductase
MTGASVLVLGASGFLGGAVARAFVGRGFRVSGTWHTRPQRVPAGVEPLPWDAVERGGRSFDVIAICAGWIPWAAMDRPDPRLDAVNADLPGRVCARFPTSRVVLASSVAVYGGAQSPRTETTAYVAPGAYGASKLAGEDALRRHASHAIVRFASLYGRAMTAPTFLPRIVQQAREQRVIRLLGDGSRAQDYVAIDDAAEFVVRAAALRESRTLLGATGCAVTNRRAAEIVAGLVPGTRIVHEGDDAAPSTTYAPTETFRVLDWRPPTGLEDGLREWLRD